MEPVPETERMEEFRSSPVPTLRLQESPLYEVQTGDGENPKRARTVDTTPQSPRSPIFSSPPIPYRPRTTSPYSRGHLRSKSTTSTLAPPMSRAQSMPGFNAAGHLLISTQQRPSSPLGSPIRTPRKPVDDVFPGLPNQGLRDIKKRGDASSEDRTFRATERSSSPVLGLPHSSSFSRTRRPSSPLRYLAQQNATAINTAPTTPGSITSSPYQSPRLNDSLLGTNTYPYSGSFSYPGSFASSSVPSTPTSARSRSPSISSLETIPDSPDAEEAAVEAERIAQLKAAADAADGGDDAKMKGTHEPAVGRGRTMGTGFGSRDKRKRWSVCGAERRGDLNLDTIWED